MDTSKSWVIDLEGMKPNNQTFQFHLDDSFFASLEASEIKKGSLDVQVDVHRMSRFYQLSFNIEGVVTIPCDRCLDEMQQPIETTGTLQVVMGDEYEDDGDQVMVPADEGVIDVAWNIYEFVMLAIPIRHTHEDGSCDATMLEALNGYGNDVSEEEEGEKPIDPRWSKLKEISNN